MVCFLTRHKWKQNEGSTKPRPFYEKEILWIIATLNLYPSIFSSGLSLTNDLEKKQPLKQLTDLSVVFTTEATVTAP